MDGTFRERKSYPMKNRGWQKYSYLLTLLVFVMAAYNLPPDLLSRAWAQGQGSFLADRHQAKGMNCATCHKESPPKAAVPSDTCMKCHGNAEKLAEKTSAVKPANPHDSHLGEVACDQCHRGHKAPVNACAQCHTFGFKVP
jgi:hypothetical protein